MSTRCNIAIELRPADRKKNFRTPWGEKVNAGGKPYLYVYCHNDGYPEGVGADLRSMFEGGDYNEALAYILKGDRSTTDLSYYEWREETSGAPYPAGTAEECDQQDYLYIIHEEGGELIVTQFGSEDEEEEIDDDDLYDMVFDWFNDNTSIDNYNSEEERIEDLTSMSDQENDEMVNNCMTYLGLEDFYRSRVAEILSFYAGREIEYAN